MTDNTLDLKECILPEEFLYHTKDGADATKVLYLRCPSKVYGVRNSLRQIKSFILKSILELEGNKSSEENDVKQDDKDQLDGIIMLVTSSSVSSEFYNAMEKMLSSGYVCFLDEEGKSPLTLTMVKAMSIDSVDFLIKEYIKNFLDLFLPAFLKKK